MLKKILALVKKDFLIESSYKLSFFLNVFSVATALITYFFIDKLFGNRITPHLEKFGVNYFSYVLLSTAFFSYIGVGIASFSSRIRGEQLQGTLESLLLTPTKISIIILSMGLWNLIFATLDLLLYIALGIFLFKVNFSHLNIFSTIIILILTVVTFNSLGILSASFIIVFKKGNPVGWAINTLQGLLGGVYFPVNVLPNFLQFIAQFFPITYAIKAIELAVYQGYILKQLKNECLYLLIFSFFLVPLSFSAFKFALKRARQQGSLAQH